MNKSKASKGSKMPDRPQGEQVHKDLSKKGKLRRLEEKQGKLSEIQEEAVEQSYGHEVEGSIEESKKQKLNAGQITAERFDFTFCDYFYRHNIQVDDFGERLTSSTCDYARLVTKDGIIKPTGGDGETPDDDYYDDEDLDENGKLIKNKPPKVIPTDELSRVFYFQFRVDKIKAERKVEKAINEGIGGLVVRQDDELGGSNFTYVPEPGLSKQPRIIIGACR